MFEFEKFTGNVCNQWQKYIFKSLPRVQFSEHQESS